MSKEIIVDGFSGGGGTSTGILMALGSPPDIAINHDPVAVAVHTANHPDTLHWCQNIWKAIPSDVLHHYKDETGASHMPKIGLATFSPDCTHFSKAKGGKPVKRNIRDLAWVIVAWAKLPRRQRPRVIFVENVEEFVTWGRLDANEMPDPQYLGEYFRRWVAELRRLGYRVEWRVLKASEHDTPTIRKRLFVAARNDGLPIVWPKPTHGPAKSPAVQAGKLLPEHIAAEFIDWSIPCPSIFDTAEQIKVKFGLRAIRPLAFNTRARVARGVRRYVLETATPFIIPITHHGDLRSHPVTEPGRTTTTAHRGEHAVVVPHITKFRQGATGQRVDEALCTITANGNNAERPGCAVPIGVVAPVMVGVGPRAGQGNSTSAPADRAARTVTPTEQHAVATAFLAPRYNEKDGQEPRVRSVEEAAATVTGQGNAPGMLVTPFLARTDMQSGAKRNGIASAEQAARTATTGGLAVVAPVIVKNYHGDRPDYGADEPAKVVLTGQHHMLVAPALINTRNGEREGQQPRVRDPAAPYSTVTAKGSQGAVVAAFLAQHNGGMVGHDTREPLSTLVEKGCTQAVVSAGLVQLKGSDRRGRSTEEPAPASTAQGEHLAISVPVVTKYHRDGGQLQGGDEPLGAPTTRDRFGLIDIRSVTPPLTEAQIARAREVAAFLREHGAWDDREFVTVGTDWIMIDIGMRMLTPRELFCAQGFPVSYVIDRGLFRRQPQAPGDHFARSTELEWRPVTKTHQIRLCGNSVCPPVMKALVLSNYAPEEVSAAGVPEFMLQAAE
jgi:DNA (cytosine-5)-methyltransferase 1